MNYKNYFISTDINNNVHRWYYLLKGHTNPAGKYIRGLLDDTPNVENKLLVCSQPKEKERYFSLFESYLDFIQYYKNIAEENRHFYEIILGQLPQKIHFDLDFEISEDGTVTLPDNTKIKPDQILELVINNIIEILKSNNIIINISEDLLIYTSHSSTKNSYHILVTNYCHSNNLEAKHFFNLIYAKLPENIKVTKYVDSSVYSNVQQFRILYSTKPNKNRYKILKKNFVLNGIEYTHKYIAELKQDDPKRDQFEFMYQLEESLISNINNCKLLPDFGLEPESKNGTNFKNVSGDVVLTNEIVKLCMLFLGRVMNIENIFNFFQVSKVNNGLIVLKIQNPYLCPVCKRVHESENPFLRINIYSALSFYCRRASSHVLLGYIEHEFVKENTLDLNLVGPIPDKLEVKMENIAQRRMSKNGVNNINQDLNNNIEIPVQVWNNNVIGTLNEVAELTLKNKPVKVKIISDEVTNFFENIEENGIKKKEEENNDIDDLW
jgi:hypothetical protein